MIFSNGNGDKLKLGNQLIELHIVAAEFSIYLQTNSVTARRFFLIACQWKRRYSQQGKMRMMNDTLALDWSVVKRFVPQVDGWLGFLTLNRKIGCA